MLLKAGQISNLELQPKFPIVINGIHCFNYFGDFRFMQDGKSVIEDVKSPATKTPVYRLKKRCVEAFYGIQITEV